MTLEFPKLRCAVYIALLCLLVILCRYTYGAKLFEMSHQIIMEMPASTSPDSAWTKWLFIFYEYTSDEHYILAILAMSPFVCRERFWHYILCIQLATFVKLNIKMILNEPRPTWVWSDLPASGCSLNLGQPSGHATRSANFAFLIIFDLFLASEYSRNKYSELRQMSVRSNTCSFVTISLVAIFFWLFTMYDQVALAKHSIDQVLLGAQIGIWCACFSHFVLRDQIFAHITMVT